jgi:putative flavoprotein involved in K+ transport
MKKKFIVIDGGEEIGASWLSRWDSRKLFTPTENNHLPGLKFDTPKGYYPSKFEVADYFKSYVAEFEIPVQLNTLVTSVSRTETVFDVSYEGGEVVAKNVIVATGPFHKPYKPPCHTNI